MSPRRRREFTAYGVLIGGSAVSVAMLLRGESADVMEASMIAGVTAGLVGSLLS